MLKMILDLIKSQSTSGVWKLNLVDFAKVCRVGAFVGAGAMVTYVVEHAADYDLGSFEPFVIMGLTALAEMVFRAKKDNTESK
jgi:hypothetical protein